MTEKLIHCPACNSENLVNSVYCCQCGSPIRKGIPARIRKGQWIAIVVISLILSFMITSSFLFINSRQTGLQSPEKQHQIAQNNTLSELQTIEQISQPIEADNTSFNNQLVTKEKQTTEIEELVIGKVSIINSEAGIITEFPAAVISGSWLALPTRTCIGGDKWVFRVGNGKAIPIEGGLWSKGDALGFWQLADEKEFNGPDFDTWQQNLPVRLLSLKTGLLSDPIVLTPSSVQGAFIYSSSPDVLEAGIFIQNDKVVGWSFGDLLNGAYMWTLGKDTNLLYENYVDDFYNETFAGGREEFFFNALSKGRNSLPQRQLQMFADGFWAHPKLSPQETPPYLSTDTVYPYISKLVKHIMGQGGYLYIATLIDEPLLVEIRDPELLMNVILATEKSYGTERTINFIEGPGADILRTIEGERIELTQLHLQLYIGWIKKLLDEGETAQGWQIYNRAQPRFKESPELHLLAVELALADRNWAEAESLLYQREYPPALRETSMLLTDRISDLKGQENKIIIRFQPGSRDIPVNAKINNSIDHNFIVDTGASFVTVPSSTIEALGLENKMSQHQQEVQTAGGLIYAKAVTLSTIELQGWVVSDVKALVIDLPDRPGLGLIGLNFLNSFRLDLQSDEGILTLEPK